MRLLIYCESRMININKLKKYLEFLNYKKLLESSIIEEIEKHLRTDYIYNSNAIEGNTLTYNETKVILEYGVTVKGKSLNEHLEVKGQEYALKFLKEIIKENEDMNIRIIKDFHHLILAPNNIEIAGIFKKTPNFIGGSKTKTVSPFEVENKINKLIKNYKESNEDIITKVSKFHADFEKIHPFVDGNGRTGRLLMNMELMKNGYPICIIENKDRLEYYNSLELAQTKNDYIKIISFIEKNLENTFEMYFKHLSNDWKKEFIEWESLNKKINM